MILEGQDPIGSMGRDIPLAAYQIKIGFYMIIFSKFCSVAPSLDPIREELVMSLMNFIGPRQTCDPKSGKNQKINWLIILY